MLDVPYYVFSSNANFLSGTEIYPDVFFTAPAGGGVTRLIYNAVSKKTIPTFLRFALSADAIDYIDKLKNANSEGLTLYQNRDYLYAEDSSEYYPYTYWGSGTGPWLSNTLSAYTIYRSGRTTSNSNSLTGMFVDKIGTGTIPSSGIAYWGTWGFNGRRVPSLYSFNISGQGEVPGLSGIYTYMYSDNIAPLTFTGIDTGWYLCYTIESFNACLGAGSYGPFNGAAPGWGYFPQTYTGVKTFKDFIGSPEYNSGYRPIKHTHYTDYFKNNVFGGSNYRYTPVAWLGHIYEPGLAGLWADTHITKWMNGNTFFEIASSAYFGTYYGILIGDPLVKIKSQISYVSPTPTPTVTSTVTPTVTPPTEGTFLYRLNI